MSKKKKYIVVIANTIYGEFESDKDYGSIDKDFYKLYPELKERINLFDCVKGIITDLPLNDWDYYDFDVNGILVRKTIETKTITLITPIEPV